MLWIAAAALAASAQPAATDRSTGDQPRAVAQVRASVRVLSGVRLHLDGSPNAEAPEPRATVLRTDQGDQPARLIEFE